MHLWILSAVIENGGHWHWPSRSFGYFDSRNGIQRYSIVYWSRPAKGCYTSQMCSLFCMEIIVFWFNFHWKLSRLVQLNSSGNSLAQNRWQAIVRTNDGPDYHHRYMHHSLINQTGWETFVSWIMLVVMNLYNFGGTSWHCAKQSGAKPNLVAKILATKLGNLWA